ncbi:MAG: methyltransferase domain-containing protein [Heliobacteriaceae bacterium]|nr:methyltransferase domain-containing protein [Heliobacteriaceae bacterium]
MKTLPGWYYDEFVHLGMDYADVSQVEAYDQKMRRIRDVPAENNAIMAALALSSNATLLEIGTGTGALAVAAAKHCARVIATDISPAMLAYAAQRAQRAGCQNISFVNAGFLTYDHTGEPVDAVVSQLALHHLPDFWKLIALNRVYHTLKPGGNLFLRDVVFSFEADNYATFIPRWLAGLERSSGGELAAAMAKSIRDEHYTYHWVMEGLLAKAGFIIEKSEYTAGFLAAYLCRRKLERD